MQNQELHALAHELKDRSRDVAVFGNKAIVPLKFDEDGEPVTLETFNPVKHLKSFSLDHLRFLSAWRKSGWDFNKACKTRGVVIDSSQAKRLYKKLVVFKQEEERIKALADVPTFEWITARNLENVFSGTLDDSQRDSLKELAKLGGFYKNQLASLSITQNVFNLPKLDPGTEEKLRHIAEQEAQIIQEAQVVNE